MSVERGLPALPSPNQHARICNPNVPAIEAQALTRATAHRCALYAPGHVRGRAENLLRPAYGDATHCASTGGGMRPSIGKLRSSPSTTSRSRRPASVTRLQRRRLERQVAGRAPLQPEQARVLERHVEVREDLLRAAVRRIRSLTSMLRPSSSTRVPRVNGRSGLRNSRELRVEQEAAALAHAQRVGIDALDAHLGLAGARARAARAGAAGRCRRARSG